MDEKDEIAGWRSSRVGVLLVACLAVFVDMLLYGVIIPIQPRILMEVGVSVEDIDKYQVWLFASYAIGLFTSTPFFGIISDRLGDRKIPMMLGLIALAASTLLFAYVRDFTLLLAARFAQGVSAAATWVAGLAMVMDVYPADDGLGFAIGFVLSWHTVGNFVGPVLGGLVGEKLGLKYPFFFIAALSIVDLIGRLIIKPKAPQVRKGQDKSIIKMIMKPGMFVTLLTVIILSSSVCAIELFVSSWLELDWGFSETKTSLCMLAFILPNIFMASAIGWLSDRIPRHKIISFGLVLHGVCAPLIPLSWNMTSLISFSIMFGITAPIANSPITPHLTALVDSYGGESYAKIMATFNMTYCVGMIAGPWLIGFVKSYFGFAIGMTVISASSLVLAPFVFYLGRVKSLNVKQVTSSSSNLLQN